MQVYVSKKLGCFYKYHIKEEVKEKKKERKKGIECLPVSLSSHFLNSNYPYLSPVNAFPHSIICLHRYHH